MSGIQSSGSIELELREMINGGLFSRAKLSAMLREMQVETERKAKKVPRPKHEPTGAVTIYTRINRHYTCMHCGSRWNSVVELPKGESVGSLTKGGKIQMITSSSPADVDCAVGRCDRCVSFVAKMSREDLEERYLALLRKIPLAAYVEIFNKAERPTTEKVEVKL
jgi:hypothetical protein